MSTEQFYPSVDSPRFQAIMATDSYLEHMTGERAANLMKEADLDVWELGILILNDIKQRYDINILGWYYDPAGIEFCLDFARRRVLEMGLEFLAISH